MDEEQNVEYTSLPFQGRAELSSIIKIIGVGGGGGNAVNHMAEAGIKDVDFIVANTDQMALDRSPVKNKILLGPETCHGLGAGAKPELAETAAKESEEEVKTMIMQGDTQMVFITAGMGGGTGTGAGPWVAKIAHDAGLLTVGIVTIPFLFEGKKKILKAFEGVMKMGDYVDAMLVINNERLRDIYPKLGLRDGFSKADDVLLTAAKSIAEMITVEGYINLDFQDVNTTLRDAGVALLNVGYSAMDGDAEKGEGRLKTAIHDAITSPLLKNSNVNGAKNILMMLYCKEDENQLTMDELGDLNDFMSNVVENPEVHVIWGLDFDNSMESGAVKISLVATGFTIDDVGDDDVIAAARRELGVKKGKTEIANEGINVRSEEERRIAEERKAEEERIEAEKAEEKQKRMEAEIKKQYGDTKLAVKIQNEETQRQMSEAKSDIKKVNDLDNSPAYERRADVRVNMYVPKKKE